MPPRDPLVSIHSEPLPPDGLILAVEGELDMASTPELLEEFAAAGPEAPARVVIDLSACTFLDLHALRTLVEIGQQVERGGGRLAVACPSGLLRRVFELTGLDQLLAAAPSVEKAIETTAGGRPED
jgi:anti-anti-sigma factor